MRDCQIKCLQVRSGTHNKIACYVGVVDIKINTIYQLEEKRQIK